MEAKVRELLNRIRKRGITVKLVGNAIYLAPKSRLNDRMSNYIREHKEKLRTALYQEQDEIQALHQECKRTLGPRILILENLIIRFINDPSCRAMVNYQGPIKIGMKEVHDYIDSELVNFDYDLDAAIKMYEHYTPKVSSVPSQCLRCGYNQPFCGCTGKRKESCSEELL